MTDRPILFSAPMVRALLAGRKTQTRRVLGKTGHCNIFEPGVWSDGYVLDPGNADWRARDTPFAVGDRLWVKETWRLSPEACEGWHPDHMRGWIDYQAGGSSEQTAPSFEAVERAAFLKGEDRDWDFLPSRYRPSIHMPRWASRITLLVTDVRVERLQDCSEADAIAEGAISVPYGVPPGHPEREAWHHGQPMEPPNDAFETALASYRHLWNSINGTGAWEANPWVVAVTFEVVRGNIDQVAQ